MLKIFSNLRSKVDINKSSSKQKGNIIKNHKSEESPKIEYKPKTKPGESGGPSVENP